MGGSSGNPTPINWGSSMPGANAPTYQPVNGPTNPGFMNSGAITFSNQGLPVEFPGGSLPEAYSNLNNLYYQQGLNSQQPYQNAIGNTQNAGWDTQNGLGRIYGTGLNTQQGVTNQGIGQSQDITNQNLSGLNSLMDNYDKNFVSQLGPSGQLGQQLMGEFNNYGITPSSGAFQQGLGNTLGQLGAQNQFALGSQLVNQGGAAQQGLLSQGLGGQLSTAQQGTQQAGQSANLTGLNQMQLGQQQALAPLNYMDQAVNQQAGIINQEGQLPIDYWGSKNNMNFSQNLANQNQSAQNYGANMGLLGSLGSAGLMAATK